MKNKIECWLSSLLSTIQTHNGWWISSHDYIEVGIITIEDKEWSVLICKKCNHLSAGYHIINHSK